MPWASTLRRSRTAKGGQRNKRRLSFVYRSGAPLLVEQGASQGAIVASRVGFGVLRSRTGREMLPGRSSLREAKQVLQSLIPERTRTAALCGIMPGKGLLDHQYPPSASWEETTTWETTLAQHTLSESPSPSPSTCMWEALHRPHSQMPLQHGTHPPLQA